MTFLRLDDILKEIRAHPEGVTIDDLMDFSKVPSWERESLKHKYVCKLGKLRTQGYITKVTEGTKGNPSIWRAN